MLSEFAGAAQSLGAGAILVNPWNITDLAAAIEHSLTMRYAHRLPACELMGYGVWVRVEGLMLPLLLSLRSKKSQRERMIKGFDKSWSLVANGLR